MEQVEILRTPHRFSYDMNTAAQLAAIIPINMSQFSGGSIQLGEALTVTVYGCNKENPTGETFVAASTQDGIAKAVTLAAAGVIDLPDTIFNNLWIKLVTSKAAVAEVVLKG